MMRRIISPVSPGALRHLPGIPQGTSHCCTPLHPRPRLSHPQIIPPLFFPLWEHSCSPLLLLLLLLPLLLLLLLRHSSKDASENKDTDQERSKPALLRGRFQRHRSYLLHQCTDKIDLALDVFQCPHEHLSSYFRK